jgi:hypothetical protein
MQRQTVIVLEKCPNIVECFGSLKRACKEHPELVYNTIKAKKFPFSYKDYVFHRVQFNEVSNFST